MNIHSITKLTIVTGTLLISYSASAANLMIIPPGQLPTQIIQQPNGNAIILPPGKLPQQIIQQPNGNAIITQPGQLPTQILKTPSIPSPSSSFPSNSLLNPPTNPEPTCSPFRIINCKN